MNIHESEELIHVVNNTVTPKEIIQKMVETKEISYPFHILDIDEIILNTKIWQEKLPRIKPFYAVKRNDNSLVLKMLATFGINFDCTSRSEIKKVLDLGVSPSRIIYACPSKIASHIKYAKSRHINLTTFDNELELYKLKSIHPSCDLVIQIQCGGMETQRPLGIKYGCDPQTEAPKLLKLALDLGLSVVGVSFHAGSSFDESAVFRRAISAAKTIFQLAQQLGFLNMYLLDIGGGFPTNNDISFDQIANEVNTAIDERFSLENDVTIIAEPGRFFTASAFTLATQIHSIKIQSNDKDHNIKYFINDGVYGSFNRILYDHSVVVPKPLNNYASSQIFRSSIWGPTCDDLDKVVDTINLPLMEIGNWIIFENMGAYPAPAACAFNEFPLPKIFAIASRKCWKYLMRLKPILEHHFMSLPNNSGTVEKTHLDKDDTQDNNGLDFARLYSCICANFTFTLPKV